MKSTLLSSLIPLFTSPSPALWKKQHLLQQCQPYLYTFGTALKPNNNTLHTALPSVPSDKIPHCKSGRAFHISRIKLSKKFRPTTFGAMELCMFCRDVTTNLQEAFEGKRLKLQPDFTNMIQAAGLGCKLCQFFLKCAEVLSQDKVEELRNGGQIYLRVSSEGECYMAIDRPHLFPVSKTVNESLQPFDERDFYCFDYLTPDFKFSHLTKVDVKTPSADSSSDICFAKITSWLTQCTTEHPSCGKPGEVVLPTRVIDVGSFDNQSIRLVATNGSRGTWVTLSHCWGNSVSLQLKRGCLIEMEKEIPIESLPPSFQDAVYITRRLDFHYLWIDSLCIIQDSPEDWNQESGRMAYIYSNSVLTIAAEAARDGSFGIFRSANMSRPKSSIKVKCRWNDSDLDYVWFRSRSLPDSNGFHLHQRAWALQETVLPPRVLTYTSRQLYYNCRTTQYNEQEDPYHDDVYSGGFGYHNERCTWAKQIICNASSFEEHLVMSPEIIDASCPELYPKVPDKDRSSDRQSKTTPAITVDEVLQQWWNIVEAYTIRQLTFEKDRLPAIAGIAKVVGRLTGYSYKAGLWDKDLIRGLAWNIYPSINEYRRARCSDYVAPSWSWASIPSRLSLTSEDEVEFPSNFEVDEDTKILETQLEYSSHDRYLGVCSGLLKIRGRCLPLEPEDYLLHSGSKFDCAPDDYLDSHLRRSSTDAASRLLLLLGASHDKWGRVWKVALILEETDLHGTYKRVGFWTSRDPGLRNWTIKTLTII